MCDVVVRRFCNPVHRPIHSRDDILQKIRLFADYFILDYFVRDDVRER